jgi:predicted dehydrogenase
MEILVIGNSNLFQKRILPALLNSNKITSIHLASLSRENETLIPAHKKGLFFNSYSEALKFVKPTLVYISLPNSLHANWVEASIIAGFHVIVDKPAFLNYKQSRKLIDLANKKNVCLAEATVWPYHSQIKETLEIINTENNIKLIQSIFTIPKLDNTNFRNNFQLGGGCFNDMIPYAVSPGRIFFSETPHKVNCHSLKFDMGCGIDTAFSFTATYSENKIFQGYFGFGMEYKNCINLIGEGFSIIIEPAFSSNKENNHKLIYKKNNLIKEITIDPFDSFQKFIETVITSIECGNWEGLTSNLLQDALVTNMAAKKSKFKRYVN